MMVAYRNGEKMKHSDEKRKMELPEGGEERTQTEGGAKNDNTMRRMQKTHTGENPEAMVLQKMQAEKETHPAKDIEKAPCTGHRAWW